MKKRKARRMRGSAFLSLLVRTAYRVNSTTTIVITTVAMVGTSILMNRMRLNSHAVYNTVSLIEYLQLQVEVGGS